MSQIDDLRARIDRALDDVERVNGSLSEIDALKSALGEANSRLRDNADQLRELARATETFRGSVERATRVLASLAEELTAADAVQIGREISNIKEYLKEAIDASASVLRDRAGVEHAEVLERLTAVSDRLDNGHGKLTNDVESAATKLTELMETQSRLAARSRRRWMVALIGVNLISASAVAAVVVLLLG